MTWVIYDMCCRKSAIDQSNLIFVYGAITVKRQSKLKVGRIGKGNFTGTHRLTAIIDASWKVDEYYKGLCMRRRD